MNLGITESLPTLYEDLFMSLHFCKQEKTLYCSFKANITHHMIEEDYQGICQTIQKISKEKRPHSLFMDTTNFNFPISPTLQDWTSNIIPKKNCSLKKFAILKSQYFIADLSLEQLFEEVTSNHLFLHAHCFEDVNKALSWLKPRSKETIVLS